MMKTKKVSLIAGISVCSLVVLLTVVYAVLTDAFVSAEKYAPPCDIEESYAKDAIEWVVQNGWMTVEMIDGQAYFFPKNHVTRGEIAKILVSYLDIDSSDYADAALGFADETQIPTADLPDIRAVVSCGHVKLFSDYTYRRGATLTREETADIFAPLCRTSASTGKTGSFSDYGEVSLYFEENVRKLVDLEILIGYPDGKLRPKNDITREELAIMLYRLAVTESGN
jgi:hypothetical protein